jgi:hypothetical protein
MSDNYYFYCWLYDTFESQYKGNLLSNKEISILVQLLDYLQRKLTAKEQAAFKRLNQNQQQTKKAK